MALGRTLVSCAWHLYEQNLERLRAAFLLTERHAKSLAQENIDLKLKVAQLEGRVLTQDELRRVREAVVRQTLRSTETGVENADTPADRSFAPSTSRPASPARTSSSPTVR